MDFRSPKPPFLEYHQIHQHQLQRLQPSGGTPLALYWVPPGRSWASRGPSRHPLGTNCSTWVNGQSCGGWMIDSKMRDEANLDPYVCPKRVPFSESPSSGVFDSGTGVSPLSFSSNNIFVIIDNIDILVEGRSPVDSCIASTARATRGWSPCALEAAVDASCL